MDRAAVAAFTGFLGVLLVLGFGNRAFGPPVGALAAAVLAGRPVLGGDRPHQHAGHGRFVFHVARGAGLALAQLDDASPRERWLWMHAAWAAAAFALLSKGLIGIVLPAGAVALYVLVQRD